MSETLGGEVFDRGIAYEGLRESINNEMARHNAIAAKHGHDTEPGRQHLESMAALAEVRRHLSPDNTELLLVVELMLKSARSDRREDPSAA